MSPPTPAEAKDIISTWLASFSDAVERADARAVAATLQPHGWLRDVLTFTWDTRSLSGREAVESYLSKSGSLANAQISKIALDTDPHLPSQLGFGPAGPGVEVWFTYEARYVTGKGSAFLQKDEQGAWRALTLATIATELKGHEELAELDWEASGKTWGEFEEERIRSIEENPYVLVVGAGENGLTVAARFRQMNIPTLVIERNARVGDNWRERYRSLALHTPKDYSQFLYQNFPTNWPTYASRDKIASWLETYAVSQHVALWTHSTLASPPTYDPTTKRWTAVVDHAGTPTTVHPAHIVLATGLLGTPRAPTLPNRDAFQGTVLHAAHFVDAKPFAGKRVVVVGAGNSAVDISQDLVHGRAAGVTVVQRSSSCVVSRSNVREDLAHVWDPARPVYVGDLRAGAVSLGFMKQLRIGMQAQMWAREKVLHDKLRKGGVKLNMGRDGAGQFIQVFERGGGYWLDKGAADLIASGDIKVKQGVTPTAFTRSGLRFSDDSELDADVVIFATGYDNIRDVNKRLLGEDVINRTTDAWGLDSEGEIKGCYRPTGHPGLWYALGDFYTCRAMSKQLGILIKAGELGMYDAATEANSALA